MSVIQQASTRQTVWEKTNGRCACCGKQTNPWRDFCVDHILPRARGGGDEVTNLAPACRGCNRSKGYMTMEGFHRSKDVKFEFSEPQLALLTSAGITPPVAPSHVFWFEQEGINLSVGMPHEYDDDVSEVEDGEIPS